MTLLLEQCMSGFILVVLDSRCEEGDWKNVHQKTDLVVVKGKSPRELKHRNN